MLFFLQNRDILSFIAFILVAVLAFAYHEFGHALVADRLGDPTPRSYGRMTLNPLPHLSLFGMAMLILIGFGWAVTPINPRLMRGNPRVAHAQVAIAGPAANLIMAIAFAIPLRILYSVGQAGYSPLSALPPTLIEFLFTFMATGVSLNLFLIGFNLLPIPPLDGFWILRGLLPADLAYQLDPLQRYGTILFFLVIFILPRFGLSIFPVISAFTNTVFSLLVGF